MLTGILLTKENCPLTQGIDSEKRQQQKTLQLLVSMKQEAQGLAKSSQKLVLETLSLIETELSQSAINATLMRALIANLRPYTELSVYRRRLAEVLEVELI